MIGMSIRTVIAGRSGRMSKALAGAIARDEAFVLSGSFTAAAMIHCR